MGEIAQHVNTLEAQCEQFECDLSEIRTILRERVGGGHGTTVQYAREAVRKIDDLQSKIDEAAACVNTKALREAHARIEGIERDNKLLSDALDSERRQYAEVNKKLLSAKNDVEFYRNANAAQRARADEAETKLADLKKRTYGPSALAVQLDEIRRERDGLRDDLTACKKVQNYWKSVADDMKAELEAAEEKLRRKRHETTTPDDVVQAAERMRVIRKIADDRGSFWVQGIRYVPDCRTEVNADAVAKLEKIVQMLEAFKK